MTDKQIIIDGVDVSGCSYGEIEKNIFKCSCEYNVRSASMFCKDNPNCYYKQLKRKEQECERLKEEMFAHFHKTGEVPALFGFTIDDIANLVEENNTLKQYKKSKQASYEEMQKRWNNIELENRKLKQTLIEMKEYCTDMKKDHYWGMRMMRFANEVLQIISEVLDE